MGVRGGGHALLGLRDRLLLLIASVCFCLSLSVGGVLCFFVCVYLFGLCFCLPLCLFVCLLAGVFFISTRVCSVCV